MQICSHNDTARRCNEAIRHQRFHTNSIQERYHWMQVPSSGQYIKDEANLCTRTCIGSEWQKYWNKTNWAISVLDSSYATISKCTTFLARINKSWFLRIISIASELYASELLSQNNVVQVTVYKIRWKKQEMNNKISWKINNSKVLPCFTPLRFLN